MTRSLDNTESRQYDILDLTKFILSMMIAAIHSELLPNILYPWLRLAVPLFFAISSFLLFKKINVTPKKQRDSVVTKYVVRQLKLYAFWFIALLPFTIAARLEWFENGFLSGMHLLIKNLLFSSTFIASWFITASIEGTVIVYNLSKRINRKVLFFIFLIVYCICCLISSYSPLFYGNEIINRINSIYSFIFPSPVYSFPVALIWIFIGKLFAENHLGFNRKTAAILTCIFSICLYLEWRYVTRLTGDCTISCLFFLLPVVIPLFQLIIGTHITLENGKTLRTVSTITYPLHASLVPVFKRIIRLFISNDTWVSILCFVCTLLACYIASAVIMKLEKRKQFSFLKYAH